MSVDGHIRSSNDERQSNDHCAQLPSASFSELKPHFVLAASSEALLYQSPI
jgi:hypothetical protein